MASRQIVLVGGGHAHMQVIKALTRAAVPNYSVTLIDPSPTPCYSGMVPGCVSGLYTQDQTKIQLAPLAAWAGIDYRKASVIDICPEEQTMTLSDSSIIKYDVASLDIGSRTRDATTTPGVSSFAIPTRPISDLVTCIETAEQKLTAAGSSPASVVVVGAGAAGIELALAMRARWSALFPSADFKVTLLDAGAKLVPHESADCQQATNDALAERNIGVEHGCEVKEVTEAEVLLKDGRVVPASHVIWATGAQAHPLAAKLQERGLGVDARGWVQVNRHLQSRTHSNIFAAGDCCSVVDDSFAPPPKAGVYAVRSGPVLVENIVKLLEGKALTAYKPQDDFLKLLMTGDGQAIGFRFGMALKGKWVWEMKDHIDGMFMDLFKEERLGDAGGGLRVEQYDAKDVVDVGGVGAEEAERELGRTDDGVDYLRNWGILKKMIGDDAFRGEVQAARKRAESSS